VLLPPWARSQSSAGLAPVYSLPAVGTWVEYGWKALGAEGKEQAGTLRISFVGQKAVRGAPYCWVEIQRVSGEGERAKRWVRKLLVARDALVAGAPWRGHVLEAYDQQGKADAPVTRLSGGRLDDFLGLGFRDPDGTLKVVGAKETAKTALGEFVTRHVSAAGNVRGRALEYHAWLTGEVPFGWARLEVRERPSDQRTRTVFSATAEKTGKGARSELDETKAQ
jgi:hypothetical protein